MGETKRTKSIAFRLTDEEYRQIEKAAMASGNDPNTWCRQTVLARSTEGHSFTENERLIYQEIALLRFLVGHGSNSYLVGMRQLRQLGKSSRLRPIRGPTRSSMSYYPGDNSHPLWG